jgi:hypothetical protein
MLKNLEPAGPIYGIPNRILEPEINRLATTFVEENYERLVTQARKMGRKMGVNPELCYDIVHDVYVSLQRSENNGEGYDPNKGRKSDYISLEEFVYGRLKSYSRNEKYKLNPSKLPEVAACSSTNDIDEMTDYQKAYEMASTYDDIEAIDMDLSISEELEYCLTFASSLKLNIRYLLKHLAEIAKIDIDTSIFNQIRTACKDNEFMEALKSLLQYAIKYPEKYDALVSNL